MSLPGESQAVVKVFNAAPCGINVDSNFYVERPIYVSYANVSVI